MKTLFIKFGLILVFLAFVNYVVFAIMGCLSCVLGATDTYFCDTFCWLIKGIAGSTILLWLAFFSYSILQYRKTEKRISH